MKRLLIATLGLFLAGSLQASTYTVDLAHSHVGFKIRHLMISNVKGNFNKFSGSMAFDDANKKILSIKGSIQVDSIDTGIAKRDAHLKNEDFFDSGKFPTITFVSTKVEGDTMHGNLTMHGVTKPVTLELEVNGPITSPRGKIKVGVSLSGKVSRKDFGLTYNRLLEAGGVAIGDKVKLEIELEMDQAK